MLLIKGILPACIIFIGGMNLVVGQPALNLSNHLDNSVNSLTAFTPADRPQPQRTRGGGSRLHEVVKLNQELVS
jgi:hypothetical protein